MLSVKIGQYHPSLENSFVNTIQTLKKDGPLTPLAVVAPTNWMLNRLQERLVMRQDASPGSRYTKTSFMNISFMNFYVFASEICRRSGADVGQIVRHSVVYEYLIAGLLKQHTHGEPLFKNVQSLPALAGSLYQVIQDLADANVHIDSLKEAVKEGFIEGAEVQKLNGVINLYDLFKQKLKNLHISHYADVYHLAASCVQDSKFLKNFKYILAYGFYDLTGVEQDFFGEIFKSYPAVLFLPYQKKHPSFGYVKPFFESFVLGLARDVEELPPVTGFSCLMNSQLEDNAHVREFQGEIQNPKLVVSEVEPSETCGEQSQTIQHPDNTQYLANVHIINASGKRDEVWTVAKEILQLAGAGYKMDEIGVVARTLEPYADAINKIFQENDIPFTTSTHEPLERYPLVKVIRQILLLKREDYYRPMVVELLNSPYFKTPAFDHKGVTPRPDLWDILSRRLGIRGGIECWLSRLEQAKSMEEETLDLDNAANMSKGVTKKVTVHPHLNLPHQGGGIQGNNEYSPPLVGGVRGGGELLHNFKGETWDLPPIRSTLQIGEPSVIAQETGVTTVADFRPRDMAAGGQGAPLVPYVDFLLFRDKEKGRALQNIGGIANVTILPKNCGINDVIAFDTGPGNMIIDRITELVTNTTQHFDEGGKLAERGKIHDSLLATLLTHPYLSKPPPKTTGREEFGISFADNLYKDAIHSGIEDLDILATVTAFTAHTIADSYKQWILSKHYLSEVILSGGGSHNNTLIKFFRQYLKPTIQVHTIDKYGISPNTKEALAFAILANETISGNPNNVPSATGAREAIIMGKIIPGKL